MNAVLPSRKAFSIYKTKIAFYNVNWLVVKPTPYMLSVFWGFPFNMLTQKPNTSCVLPLRGGSC